MSEDFGKSVRRPPLDIPGEKEALEAFPEYAHLSNASYNRILKDYCACATKYLNEFYDPVILEKQLNRRDLDTVCAYELYQMKK